MAYKNQNYMTNVALKEQADQAQKQKINTEIILSDVVLIDSEESYNAQLSKANSALNKYYNKYPREDGIDSEGHPVRDPNTEVVGHSWESAITAPTDPAKTSTFPWLALNMDNLTGTLIFKYNDEIKLTWNITNKSFAILSIPSDLNMPDYRLEWGTGNKPSNVFDINKLKVIFEEQTQE